MDRMKRLALYLPGVLLCVLAFAGCVKKEYYEGGGGDGAQIATYYFDVLNNPTATNRWHWNEQMKRNECIFDFNALTPYIYEKGVVHASVFHAEQITENGVPVQYETLKSLPFVRSYWDPDQRVYYTETIGYDVAPGNPYTICFYIQTDDLGATGLQDYKFKVSLLWY